MMDCNEWNFCNHNWSGESVGGDPPDDPRVWCDGSFVAWLHGYHEHLNATTMSMCVCVCVCYNTLAPLPKWHKLHCCNDWSLVGVNVASMCKYYVYNILCSLLFHFLEVLYTMHDRYLWQFLRPCIPLYCTDRGNLTMVFYVVVTSKQIKRKLLCCVNLYSMS